MANAPSAEEAITGVFRRRAAQALFVTEVQYAVEPRRDPAEFAAALARLVERGELIVVEKPSPDPHLADADLRIVARATPAAAGAVEATWNDWLREFLASHRCS